MARKSKTVAAQPAAVPTFQGAYVDDVRDALIASALSGHHVILLSAPGWGKTNIAVEVGKTIAGDNHVFIPLDSTTPPEAISGMIDPAAILDTPPRLVKVTKGTPYDPEARIITLDEIGRASEIVFDMLLHVLQPYHVDPDLAPSVWATSNFAPAGDRQEALRDRFALWMWVSPQSMDIKGLVRARAARQFGQSMAVPNGVPIPTWDEVVAIRKSRPNTDTAEVIAALIETLSAEATQQGYQLSPRRITQWYEILYRVGAWYAGNDQFDQLPTQASRILRWAWPTFTPQESSKWIEVAGAAADVVGAAIEAMMDEAYSKFREIAARSAGGDAMKRLEVVAELGTVLAERQRSLGALGTNDNRVIDAMENLNMIYSKIARGDDPFSEE